jgi:GcrA cell cycle regulator
MTEVITSLIPKSQWTEEKVKLLKQLLKDGMATTKIAITLGTTRNAVIGKAARSGLALVGCSIRKPAVKRHRPRLVIYRTYAAFAPEYEMCAEATKPAELATSEPCDLFGLTTQTCHWPLWDGPETKDKRYCGAPTEGRVYCKQHALTATVIHRRAVTPKPFLLP